jgi:hypothetical protein
VTQDGENHDGPMTGVCGEPRCFGGSEIVLG